ncbi:MAG: DUF983 domain-containing protein [Rhodoblastus sp.]
MSALAPTNVARAKPADRDAWQAARRGFACRCPACGEGRLYKSYLKVADRCDVCGTELHHHRADDAPPYFTIFIVGHFVIAAILAFDEYWPDAPYWLHALLWSAFIIVSSLWLLPLVKGALVGYQWALRMHGFGGVSDEEAMARLTAAKPAIGAADRSA